MTDVNDPLPQSLRGTCAAKAAVRFAVAAPAWGPESSDMAFAARVPCPLRSDRKSSAGRQPQQSWRRHSVVQNGAFHFVLVRPARNATIVLSRRNDPFTNTQRFYRAATRHPLIWADDQSSRRAPGAWRTTSRQFQTAEGIQPLLPIEVCDTFIEWRRSRPPRSSA